ncbi:MAG: hypothetical protein HY934_06965, partial [Candidatus Firestonebacteria bacterium]|nr:hypothetical protein [Candidatus Firestonebacteria bacterium]
MKYIIILIIISLCLFLFSCAGKQVKVEKPVEIKEEILECYPLERPEWMDKTPQTNDNFEYFVGHSGKTNLERDAREDALANAINQFVKYCGVEVKTIDEYLAISFGKSSGVIDPNISLKEQNKQRAQAFVSRIKSQEWYNCKIKYSDEKIIQTGWISSVLVSVPKDEIEKVREYDRNLKEAKIQEEKERKNLLAFEQKRTQEAEMQKKQIEIDKLHAKVKNISDIYTTVN